MREDLGADFMSAVAAVRRPGAVPGCAVVVRRREPRLCGTTGAHARGGVEEPFADGRKAAGRWDVGVPRDVETTPRARALDTAVGAERVVAARASAPPDSVIPSGSTERIAERGRGVCGVQVPGGDEGFPTRHSAHAREPAPDVAAGVPRATVGGEGNGVERGFGTVNTLPDSLSPLHAADAVVHGTECVRDGGVAQPRAVAASRSDSVLAPALGDPVPDAVRWADDDTDLRGTDAIGDGVEARSARGGSSSGPASTCGRDKALSGAARTGEASRDAHELRAATARPRAALEEVPPGVLRNPPRLLAPEHETRRFDTYLASREYGDQEILAELGEAPYEPPTRALERCSHAGPDTDDGRVPVSDGTPDSGTSDVSTGVPSAGRAAAPRAPDHSSSDAPCVPGWDDPPPGPGLAAGLSDAGASAPSAFLDSASDPPGVRARRR